MREPIYPSVHIILHVQDDLFEGYFGPEFVGEYLDRLESNTAIIRRRRTPVIIVGDTKDFNSEQHTLCVLTENVEPGSPHLPVKDLRVAGKRGDILCAGGKEHPFVSPMLMDLLKRWKTKTVTLVGGLTSACIGDTICRAVDNNLYVNVVLDGLVDCNHRQPAGSRIRSYCDTQESILAQTCDYPLDNHPRVRKITYSELFNPPAPTFGASEPARRKRSPPALLRKANI